MSGKIIAAMAVTVLLATTSFASARTKAHHHVGYGSDGRYYSSYYDQQYWNAVTPRGVGNWRRDPYAGTIWDDVAPY
jgi:hypothetical protein